MAGEEKFSELLAQLDHAHKVRTDAAFERGREVGRQEALAELKQTLSGFLASDGTVEPGWAPLNQHVLPTPTDTPIDEAPKRRASPGSVKPAITQYVLEHPGSTTEEVRKHTGAKSNSVRGTLWTLTTEGMIERRDGRWFPVVQKNEAIDAANSGDTQAQKNEAAGEMSEPDAPTASVENAHPGVFD